MTPDAVQTELQVPQIDWDTFDTGGAKKAPPQAKGSDGKYIQYYVQAPESFTDAVFGPTQLGYLKAEIGPLTFVNSGAADGGKIMYQTVSSKPYEKNGKPINANQFGTFLRAAGTATLLPNTVDGYKAATRAAANAIFPVIIEWELKDRETKEVVYKSYDAFPGNAGEKSPVVTVNGRTLVAYARVKAFLSPRA